jgi:hypothetical protein
VVTPFWVLQPGALTRMPNQGLWSMHDCTIYIHVVRRINIVCWLVALTLNRFGRPAPMGLPSNSFRACQGSTSPIVWCTSASADARSMLAVAPGFWGTRGEGQEKADDVCA